jgi:hypothetical protein
MNLKETGSEGVNWFRLAHDRLQGETVTNPLMNLRSPYKAGDLTSGGTAGFWRWALLHLTSGGTAGFWRWALLHFVDCQYLNLYQAYGTTFPRGVKRGQGVMLTTQPHLVPRLIMSRSYTSSPPRCLHGVERVPLPFVWYYWHDSVSGVR